MKVLLCSEPEFGLVQSFKVKKSGIDQSFQQNQSLLPK